MRRITLGFGAGFLTCLALIILVAAKTTSPTAPLDERDVLQLGGPRRT